MRWMAVAMVVCGGWGATFADPAPEVPEVRHGAIVEPEEHHDTSPPLWLIRPATNPALRREHRPLPIPRPHADGTAGTTPVTTSIEAEEEATPEPFTPSLLLNFGGVGNGFSGPSGSFVVQSAPPDTVGDVGPNHYVQSVNTDFAVFNKSGTAVYGPVAINTLWSGFGGGCQVNNDGDAIVLYDPIADRWMISQYSVSSTPYLECVAVSQTPDPTGSWYRYAFSYGNINFPDYPKSGVWPDAYYFTFNTFPNGQSFGGANLCAYDRAKMLVGAAATQQCFLTSPSYGGILPADLDGARQPPAGSPEYFVGQGTDDASLAWWKFHVDWVTAANSTLTGPVTITVPAYTEACSGGTCIPQSGTTQQLDSLGDRMMFRLAYRNFGDHESLVTNHSVMAGSSAGVRWYELRVVAGSNLSLFQSGTYAPDSNFRWMGSIAMDQQGNIGLEYSISSSSLHPQIHYTGRLSGDAPGQMTQGEGTLINGAGSQTGSSLSRWGDYSAMSVDPSDDCTFWATNEYIPANGAFNWSTRIGSFRLCTAGIPNDFTIVASPTSLTLGQGASGSSTISTAVSSGSAQSITLSVSGLPAGATAGFSPTTVMAGGSSTLTVGAGTALIDTYSLTVTGTGTSTTHTTPLTLNVTAACSQTNCNDGNPCTDDVCDAFGQCVHTNNNAPCDDGNACTGGDACSGGMCQPGLPQVPDLDGDGHTSAACGGDDCDDANPGVWHVPGSVTGLLVSQSNATTVSWDSQGAASGPATVYDLVSGPLTNASNPGFSAAACLQPGGGTSYADSARPNPAIGTGYWYLSRARNSCGTGTYGSLAADGSIPACP